MSSKSQSGLADFPDLLALTLAWIIGILLVNPAGNFPLNDDWAYALPVKSLLEEGVIRIPGWASMSLYFHIFIGALAGKIVGFSFDALRATTLAFGWAGILATYFLFKETGISRTPRLAGTFALAFNPLYFPLSYSFMTDVPFYTVFVLAAYCFLKFLRTRDGKYESLGAVFSWVAIGYRQFGIIVSASYAAARFFQKGISLTEKIRSFYPFLVGVAELALIHHLFKYTHGDAGNYVSQVKVILSSDHRNQFYYHIWEVCASCVAYLGLFLIPAAAARYAGPWGKMASRKPLQFIFWAFFAVYGCFLLTLVCDFQMPLTQNMIHFFGLGPVVLRSNYPYHPSPSLVAQPLEIFWLAVASASTLGMILMAASIFWRGKTQRVEIVPAWRRAAFQFILFCIFLYLAALMVFPVFFDRYILHFVPFMMLLIFWREAYGGPQEKIELAGKMLVGSLLVVLAYFSVAGTHDYLAWNRARWQALRELTDTRKIPVDRIDGGFEFNCWHSLDRVKFNQNTDLAWRLGKDDYIIGLSPVKGYRKFLEFRFKRWLPPGKSEILVLKKDGTA